MPLKVARRYDANVSRRTERAVLRVPRYEADLSWSPKAKPTRRGRIPESQRGTPAVVPTKPTGTIITRKGGRKSGAGRVRRREVDIGAVAAAVAAKRKVKDAAVVASKRTAGPDTTPAFDADGHVLVVGDTVRAADRDNYGRVVDVYMLSAQVLFVSPAGNMASPWLDTRLLTIVRKRGRR